MLFIDFDKYKIIKEFHASETSYEELEPVISMDKSLIELKSLIRSYCNIMIKPSELPMDYQLHFYGEGEATAEEEEFFLSLVNITCAEFFNLMITPVERKTEYRLDVPDKLKGLHISYSLLKKACNYELVNKIFNLTIKYKNLSYMLCDTKDIPEKEEFVHTVDELEEKESN